MTTEHPKVTVYVPQPIFNALDDWKSQNNIVSRSAALVAILADYLVVAYPVRYLSTVFTALSNLPSTVLAELAELSRRVTILEQQIRFGTVLSNSPSTVLTSDAELANITSLENIETSDEALGTLPSTVSGEVLIESARLGGEVPGSVPITAPVTPLSQATLAKRLGCSDKAIEKQ